MLSYEVFVSIYKNITRFYAKCQNDYATPKCLWVYLLAPEVHSPAPLRQAQAAGGSGWDRYGYSSVPASGYES